MVICHKLVNTEYKEDTYFSFFFVVASTTQSPIQLRSVSLGRRSTYKDNTIKYDNHVVVNIPKKKVFLKTIIS
jgi:hypothetical protein